MVVRVVAVCWHTAKSSVTLGMAWSAEGGGRWQRIGMVLTVMWHLQALFIGTIFFLL